MPASVSTKAKPNRSARIEIHFLDISPHKAPDIARRAKSYNATRPRKQIRIVLDSREPAGGHHVHTTRKTPDQIQTDHGRRWRPFAPRFRVRQHVGLRSVPAARRLSQ